MTDVKHGFGACMDRGLDDFRFHDLRHTAGTRWLTQALTLLRLQRFWATPRCKMTKRYTHATDERSGRLAKLTAAKVIATKMSRGGLESPKLSVRNKTYTRSRAPRLFLSLPGISLPPSYP